MYNGRWMVAVAMSAVAGLFAGCKSLDEYRQLEMAHRRTEAEKQNLETELYDARSNNENLRVKLAAAEDKLADREKVVTNLQSENEGLQKAFGKAQSTLETLASKDMFTDPIVIETKLPAELDSALKDFAGQHPSEVKYDPQRGIVKWTSDLVFALGSDIVKDSARDSLTQFADIMKSPAAQGFDVLVVGHTDDRPISRPETRQKHPTNWHLSAHRAIAVGNVLIDRGITPERVGVTGFGEYRPIADNATEAGRQQNRRVEIYVVPSGSIGGVIAPPKQSTAAETTTVTDGIK